MTTTQLTKNTHLLAWVDEMAKLTKPDRIVWVDGSEEEHKRLTEIAARPKAPSSRSTRRSCPAATTPLRTRTTWRASSTSPSSARPPRTRPARPTTGWRPTRRTRSCAALFDGAMKGRTMYVMPYVMGPLGSPLSKVGVELTDSVYVVLNMRIMTRMGKVALDHARRQQRLQPRPALARSTSIPSAASSATSRRTTRSGPSAPATAATCCSARSAWRCASAATSARRKAGSPSTCSSSASRAPRARSTTSRRPSRAPAARPTSPC